MNTNSNHHEIETCNNESSATPNKVIDATNKTIDAGGELLTDKQAAIFLQMGVRTIHRYNFAGKIPAPRKIGRCLRWSRSELKAWTIHDSPPRAKWNELWETLRNEWR